MSGTVDVTAVSDDPSVVALQFRVNGANLGPEIVAGACTALWNTDAGVDGSYTVDAVVRDNTGTVSVVPAVAVSVNNHSAPSINGSLCATPDPFVALGGGTCVNGGWYPPGIVPNTLTTLVPRPTEGVPRVDGCSTPDPFVSLGGGTCFNGGWYPPGLLTASTPTTPTAGVPTEGVRRVDGCSTPDPFVLLGGGTCANGGWQPPVAAPQIILVGATVACSGPDPFAAIPGLKGVCEGGGWVPVRRDGGGF